MRRSRRLSLAILCTLPVALGAAAPASADKASEKVFAQFAFGGGVIDPCKFTPAELKHAKNNVPSDVEQYSPDFRDAIDAALAQRAQGVCDKKAKKQTPAAAAAPSSGTPSTPAAPKKSTATPAPETGQPTASTPTPQPAPAARPVAEVTDGAILAATRNTGGDGDLPAPLVGLAFLALLAALAGLAVATARWFAFEPPWLVRSRHATAEAGWRTSAAWAEFTDWLRLGR